MKDQTEISVARDFGILGKPDEILEIETISAEDELPYLFEMTAGQTLDFSFAAILPVMLVLCTFDAYESWIDSGFDTEVPRGSKLVCQSCQLSVTCEAEKNAEYAVVLMNWSDRPLEVLISAKLGRMASMELENSLRSQPVSKARIDQDVH